MLKNIVRFLETNKISVSNKNILFRLCSTETSKSKDKWDLLGAICLERRPVITPELNALEKKFKGYLDQIEFEKSMKSLHEIRHEQDLLTAEAVKKGDMGDLDLDIAAKQTAQDFEDACNEEFSKFKFTDRITEADKKDDTKSLERKLSNHLVFVTEQTIGKKKYFLLPQNKWEKGETLRQTAERVLKTSCGADIKAKIFGNAPVGFYKYRYPKSVNGDAVGAKVFIYFARYVDGQIADSNLNYHWLDRKELQQKLPPDYYQDISKFLIDEI